jgi:DNA-binding transcriptional regulator of glucitol operon
VHAATVLLVAGFLALGWWQVGRASGGNLLSFGYAVEWPAFAAFAVYVWVKEMRQALGKARPGAAVKALTPSEETGATAPVRRRRAPSAAHAAALAAHDDTDDEELLAYNEYLAWRGANPHAPASEYPGYTG